MTQARVSQIRSEALTSLRAWFGTLYEGAPDVSDDAAGKRARAAYVAQLSTDTNWRSRLDAADDDPRSGAHPQRLDPCQRRNPPYPSPPFRGGFACPEAPPLGKVLGFAMFETEAIRSIPLRGESTAGAAGGRGEAEARLDPCGVLDKVE